MIKVKVIFMGYLADFTKAKEVELELVESSIFKDLLNEVKENYIAKFPNQYFQGDDFRYLHLMLNLKDIDAKKDADRPLENGDTFYLIPPVGGG